MNEILCKLQNQIDYYKAINDWLMSDDISVTPWTEVDQNRGCIIGLNYAITLIENYEKAKIELMKERLKDEADN